MQELEYVLPISSTPFSALCSAITQPHSLCRMFGPISLPSLPSGPLPAGAKKEAPPPPPPRPARSHTRSSSLDLNKFSELCCVFLLSECCWLHLFVCGYVFTSCFCLWFFPLAFVSCLFVLITFPSVFVICFHFILLV